MIYVLVKLEAPQNAHVYFAQRVVSFRFQSLESEWNSNSFCTKWLGLENNVDELAQAMHWAAWSYRINLNFKSWDWFDNIKQPSVFCIFLSRRQSWQMSHNLKLCRRCCETNSREDSQSFYLNVYSVKGSKKSGAEKMNFSRSKPWQTACQNFVEKINERREENFSAENM